MNPRIFGAMADGGKNLARGFFPAGVNPGRHWDYHMNNFKKQSKSIYYYFKKSHSHPTQHVEGMLRLVNTVMIKNRYLISMNKMRTVQKAYSSINSKQKYFDSFGVFNSFFELRF